MKTISIKLLDYCHYIFFITFTIIGLFIYQDYGFNIDETFTRKSGLYWLVFLSDFFSFDEISKLASEKLNSSDDFTTPWSNTYGIIFDVPAALIEIVFSIDEPLKVYQMRHVLTFFYFLVGLIFLYKILQNRFKNKLLSLFGCFLLILTPRVFGEIFHNSKDIVFLSLFIITIFFYFKTIEKGNYKYLILFSLFSAFTTSSRIFGIVIPVIFLFIYFLSVLSHKKEIKNYKTIVVYLLLYFFFLYLHWPYLWEAPFNNFFEYFKNLNIFGPKMIYFSGEYYNTELVPYSYLPVWIFISTPILNLLLFFLGFFFNFKIFFVKLLKVDEIKNKYDFWNNINEKKDFVILILFIVFIIAGIFLSPKQYNGWRIFYFLNFFIVYYSIFFINYFTKNKDFKKYIIPLCVVMFFLISINIYKIFIYHPYQSYYFNDFITKKVKKQFEGDYSGLSGISFLREITKEDKSSYIKIAVNSWYPLWRMKELLPHKDKIRIKFIFNNKNEANYIYSNEIFDIDVRKSKKYKLDPSFKIYKRYIVNDVIIYKIYIKK